MSTGTDIQASVVLPDGTHAPLESDAAKDHILDVADRARDDLFDGAQYDTPLPKLHGHRPDALKLRFGGGIDIELTDERLVDYLKTLRLGQELDITVSARVAKVNWAHAIVDDDTGDEKVTHLVGLTVDSIEIPTGAE